ncbi:hypothetical protein G9A89_023070 [Geosiphon pyriformis]|nr:hypothetical protein G9A89_023070 [Geosiphon pyriformis]
MASNSREPLSSSKNVENPTEGNTQSRLLEFISQYLEKRLRASPLSYIVNVLYSEPKSLNPQISQNDTNACTQQFSRRILLLLQEQVAPDQSVLVTALEAYEYLNVTENLITLFISKVDSTGLQTPLTAGGNKSLSKSLISAFLSFYTLFINIKVSIHLFARAQPEYLFPGSKGNQNKTLLNDVQLIKWWKNLLQQAFIHETVSSKGIKGWYFIPGVSTEHGARLLIKDLDYENNRSGSTQGEKTFWTYGYPYNDSDLAFQVVPRLEDDVKHRFLSNLEDFSHFQGDNNEEFNDIQESMKITVKEFWELISIMPECGSGRSSAFFWVEISSGNVANNSRYITYDLTEKSTHLCELIMKEEKFNETLSILENLDFSYQKKAIDSTSILFKFLHEERKVSENFGMIIKGKRSDPEVTTNLSKTSDSSLVQPKINNLQMSIKRKRLSSDNHNLPARISNPVVSEATEAASTSNSQFNPLNRDKSEVSSQIEQKINLLSPSLIKRVKR